MAAKRAPGAGRKARGEFQGNSAVLTTRITPETRALLERAAAKSNRSLSQVVQHGLRAYLAMLKKNPDRGDHIRALGHAVMLVAQYIERATGQPWNENAFTGEALCQGCTRVIAHFAPRGTPITPPLIKETATRLAQGIARATGVRVEAAIPDAASVGETEAGKVISSIESWKFRTLDEVLKAESSTLAVPADFYFPDEWYQHERHFHALEAGRQRAQEKGKRR
jgi:hypothetical protein